MIIRVHIDNEGDIFECKYEADDINIVEGALYIIKIISPGGAITRIAGFAPGKWLFYEIGDVRIE